MHACTSRTGHRCYSPVIWAARLTARTLVAGLFLLLTACLPETPTTLPSTLTPTITVTPSPSATIVWFPATATYTPAPTRMIEPTQDQRPAVGKKLFSDNFRDETLWSTTRSEAGSVAYGSNELTLAVSLERGALHSLRKVPILTDFYLEVDILPSLCRSSDAFGLLLRAGSAEDAYRLLMNCSAQLRLERVRSARAVALQDWVDTGQIPPGGLMRARLAVWMAGSEMRVFVNDVFQFAVRDPVLTEGGLGVYARAAGDSPLTVNFSNLDVYNVDAARVPTRVPTKTPTLPSTATRRPTATTAP